MKSHEAIQSAVAGKTIEHAKRLRLGTSVLYKWQEPSTDFTDSGSLNPIDRIETIVETAISLGTCREKAIAPIQYLNERFGIIGITVPDKQVCHKELSKELLQAIKEFGDLASCASKALSDGGISRKDNTDISREGWNLLRQVALFMHQVGKAAVK